VLSFLFLGFGLVVGYSGAFFFFILLFIVFLITLPAIIYYFTSPTRTDSGRVSI
jgi:hypothetical protein